MSKLSEKSQVVETMGSKFNVKFLIWGQPGSGKTSFLGSYTKGPVHFYLTDPQGTTVLRENTNAITVDEFTYGGPKAYENFWKTMQADEKSGMFDELLDQEGLLVIDSYTTLENYLVEYVCSQILKKKKTAGQTYDIQRQDWPTISGYVLNFFKGVASLPCAVAVVCHSKTVQDDSQALYFQPTIIGQQATQAPRWFSEFFNLSLTGNSQTVRIQGNPKVPAASRLFLPSEKVQSLVDPSMDDLYNKFHGQSVNCKTR